MVWTNGPLTVWHGTVGPFADEIVRDGINLARCVDESDFGRGFYVTRIRDHAVLHANQRYADLKDQFDRATGFTAVPDPACAALIEFTIRLDHLAVLNTLAFVQGTPEWLEFVRHCRQPSYNHKLAPGTYYDVVYGPMFADDAPIEGREQIGFHSDIATGVLSHRGQGSITRGGPTI